MDWKRLGKAGLGAAEVGFGIATGNPMIAAQGGKTMAGSMSKPQQSKPPQQQSIPGGSAGVQSKPPVMMNPLDQASYDRRERVRNNYPELA